MEGPLQVGRDVEIPLSEVELRTSRSSGPGGQHANVTASRVEAVFDVDASRSLTEEQKRRVTARLGPVVRATAQDTRSQTRNRELALQRLRSRLASALVVQRPRRPTKPTAAARRKRLDSKRRRSERKQARRRPEAES
jgi:ribosome-associated protein